MTNNKTFDKIKTKIDNYFNELEENKKFSGTILVSIKSSPAVLHINDFRRRFLTPTEVYFARAGYLHL